MKPFPFILALIICVSISAQSIIDISVKGISDNKKDGAQQDRLEAILDAKTKQNLLSCMLLISGSAISGYTIMP